MKPKGSTMVKRNGENIGIKKAFNFVPDESVTWALSKAQENAHYENRSGELDIKSVVIPCSKKYSHTQAGVTAILHQNLRAYLYHKRCF